VLKKFLLFCIPFLSFSQSDEIKDVFPLLVVDSPPLFNNCLNFEESEQIKCFEESINNHISDNLIFPEESFDSKEGGRVFVNFTYDKKGSISDINVKGPNENLENEVTRVIKLLPDLFPAKKDGKDVAVSYALPVDFFLLTQFNNNEITIKKGSNIYESADNRSKVVFFTTNETILNASMKGDFWLTELNTEGTYLGYVYKDDVIEINNTKKSNYLFKEPILSNTSTTTSNSLVLNEPKKNDKLDTLILKNNIVSKEEENRPLSKVQLDQLKLDSDLDNLDYFEQKLNNQQEINRKVDGFNNSDLYYTKALKVFIKILKDEIDIKYTLLSIENPEAFKNSIYEVKKIKTSQKKVQKLRNRNNYISNQFIQKNFFSYPDDSNILRLNELIDGLKKMEYAISPDIKINNIIAKKENNLSNIQKDKLLEDENNEITKIDDNSVKETNFEDEPEVDKIYGAYSTIDNTWIEIPKEQIKIQEPKVDIISDQPKVNIEKEELKVNIEEEEPRVNIIKEEPKEDIKNDLNINKSTTSSELDVEEAKEKLKQLTSLYNQDLITKDLYDESSKRFKKIIQSKTQVNVDQAKEKLKQLTSLYNQDLISKDLFEESSKELKLLIEVDAVNRLKLRETPDITGEEALVRLKTLKTLFDQGLIDKETYDSSSEILKKIILEN